MAQLTKSQMKEMADRYNSGSTDQRVDKIDSKNRKFVLSDGRSLTAKQLEREIQQLGVRVRSKHHSTGEKKEQVRRYMEENEVFTITDIMENVPNITRVYATILANRMATSIDKNGNTKIWQYAK